MTIGYYAIPPSAHPRYRRTEPWPFCRTCVRRDPAYQVVAEIDEQGSRSITCRACKAKLRDWR